MMYVGELARRAGVTPKAVRYYERLGLINAQRTASGYRTFDDRSLETMLTIRRAQMLGLPLDQVREIVELLRNGEQPCGHVRDMLRERRLAVAKRIRELKAFDRFLRELETTVPDEGPECAILARVGAEMPRRNIASTRAVSVHRPTRPCFRRE
ncbi:MerR family transcriptional regulator [bacterium]|nr:MAG: MerR family transcriptional regulator [bacterium]